jgi:ATP-binding cassette subfamily C protein
MLSIRFEAKTAFDLNYDILEHVKKLPLSFFKKVNATYLNQRINLDSNNVISFLINDVIGMCFKWISFLIAVIVLFKINNIIAISLVVLVPLYLILYLSFKSSLFNIAYILKEEQDHFIGQMNEQLLNIKQVKFHSIHDYLGNQIKLSFNKLFAIALRHARVSSLFSSCDNIINNLFRLVLFFFGGMAIIKGKLSIGEFTMINNYFTVVIKGIRNTLDFSKNYQRTKVSQKRLDELLEMKVEQNGLIKLDSINSIELKDIHFSYEKGPKILESFSYKFEKGKIYCIIGENGTGKSTLIELLLGLVGEKYQGKVFYNDKSIEQLDMYNIRRKLIGVSEQEPVLFNDTLINNIILGNKELKKKTISEWMKKLSGETIIKRFGEDKKMKIYGKSSNISGGEKQKISIIRAVIKEPDLIVLDEPTSALDQFSTNKLKEILKEIKDNKIIIMVTHDESLINISDEIIKLEPAKYKYTV